MNWRGRISIAVGVLLLIGLPLWYFFPRWFYWPIESLDLNTAHMRTTHYALGVPFWYKSSPTFIAEQLALPHHDPEKPARWLTDTYYRYPFATPHSLASIEQSINGLHTIGVPPKEIDRLKRDLAKVLYHLMQKEKPLLFHKVCGHFLTASWIAYTMGKPFRLLIRESPGGNTSLSIKGTDKWEPADRPLVSYIIMNSEFDVDIPDPDIHFLTPLFKDPELLKLESPPDLLSPRRKVDWGPLPSIKEEKPPVP